MQPVLFTRSYCCMLVANFLLFFGFWLLIPVLPFYLKENFGCTEGLIGAVLSCYTVSALLVRPFSGYLLDTFARKPFYLLAYGVFTALFAGYVVVGTLVLFILLRVVHGLAFGTVTVGGNTLVVDIMPSARRGEGLGYYGLTNNTAMSIGPMAGLFLHGAVSFDVIFLCSLSACALGFAMACCVRAAAKKSAPVPPASGGTPARGKPALSLDRFVLLKGIPAGLSLLLLSIPYGATTNYVAMYVQEIGLAVQPGFFFTLLAAGMGVSRIFSGKYVDRGYVTECIRYGFYIVLAAFLLLSACAPLTAHAPRFGLAAFLAVPVWQGIGFGIMFPAYNSLYINLAPHNQRATATSTYLTSWDVGIGLGIAGSGLIAEHFSFAAVYLTGAVLCLLSMLYFNLVVTPHYRKYHLR